MNHAQQIQAHIQALDGEMTKWRFTGHHHRDPVRYRKMLATANELKQALPAAESEYNLSLHGMELSGKKKKNKGNVVSIGNYYTIPGGAAQYYAAGVILPPGTEYAPDPNVPQFGYAGQPNVAYNPTAQPGQPGFNPYGAAMGVSEGGYYLIPPSTIPAYYGAGTSLPPGAVKMGQYGSFPSQSPDPAAPQYAYQYQPQAAPQQYAEPSVPQGQLMRDPQVDSDLVQSVYADMDQGWGSDLSGYFGELAMPKRPLRPVTPTKAPESNGVVTMAVLLLGAWLVTDASTKAAGRRARRGR